ncbi:MAG: AAA family ATPase [Caldilineaceae bacterium SB0661_bin_32]|uniref:DNA 3'-5' helicase n=1 Tax=Caldilineaceae bacterium SB0661_bin_32 TaxID=2605255 RepID=A0A6B1D6H0_9CHLR|nr:AAA family ATPase [Caldilineaceae bacterium SB0661_bin_32]
MDSVALSMTRSFNRQIGYTRRLTPQDQARFLTAVSQFAQDPATPGLNFEKLGGGPKSNLWSLRASQELRILLAVDDGQFVFVNAGRHDVMYDWAKRRDHYVDLASEDLADLQVTVPDIPLSLKRASTGAPHQPSLPELPEKEPDAPSRAPSKAESAPTDPQLIQELIRRVFRGDFEEWQLFLHPDQGPFVNRHWSGAARIRGAAGTGKTVIGLHRLAELARRYPDDKVLFTANSRSLAELLERRFRNLPMASSNVEFANIDRIVYQYDSWTPAHFSLVDQTFEAACKELIAGSPLERISRDYLKEEIERVIKGNGLKSLEDYLSVERIGRKRSLSQNLRKLVWELFELWAGKLSERNAVTFADKRIRVRDAVQRLAQAPYRCVVVDEAQDVTLVELQLVRALVAGDPRNPVPKDGVLILDDPAQRIYAGGYRLGWANLDIAGRAQVLTENYRNVPTVYRAAMRVRGRELVALDHEDDRYILDAEPGFHEREDEKPNLVLVDCKCELLYLCEKIREFNAAERYGTNEIAVFLKHNSQVEATIRFLQSEGIPCVQLTRDGFTGDGIRVGTYDRARGLEFRAVFLPRMGSAQFPESSGEADGERESFDPDQDLESRQLELDRLYVAMTRARELLLLIADEEPCEEIRRALGEEIILRDLRGQSIAGPTPTQ